MRETNKMVMEIEYIKAGGKYYTPQKAGVKDPSKTSGNLHVCIIKKLLFGRYQIDYYCDYRQFYELGGYQHGNEDKPNTRLILYPAGIEEIRFVN